MEAAQISMGVRSAKNRAVTMKRVATVMGIVVVLAGIGWLGHPVCVPIADDDLKSFTPVPIEQRTDRDLFGFRTFQRRDGHWCQCKSWISRQLFF